MVYLLESVRKVKWRYMYTLLIDSQLYLCLYQML
jgi:hypothetical protein